MGHSYKANTAISMLVIKLEAQYFKKAIQRTYFTCSNGLAIKEAIAKSKLTGEAHLVECTSAGKNSQGELISEFKITWSFKAKTGV
jgi:hypothetical protein